MAVPGIKRLSQLTVALCLAFLLLELLPNLLYRSLGWVPGYWATLNWWEGRAGGDSWEPIAAALRHLSSAGPAGLYEATYYRASQQFLYPPQSLVLFRLLDGTVLAGGWQNGPLNRLSFWIVVASAALAGLTAVGVGRVFPAAACRGRADALLRFAAGAALAIGYHPLVASYTHGNIQSWLNAAMLLAVLAWMFGRRVLAGVMFGLYCVIKPYMAPIALWLLVRREWPALGGMMGVLLVLSAVSLVTLGWEIHLDYLHLLRFLSGRGESFLGNQSLNGLLNRMFFLGPNLEWDGTHTLLRYNAYVHAASLANTVLMVGSCVWVGRRGGAAGAGVDVAIALLSVMMSSALIYGYQYGALMTLFFVAAAGLVARPPARPALAWSVLGLAFSFCAVPVSGTDLLADTGLNFLQSHSWFGGLALLFLLHRTRLRLPSAA